MAGQSGGTKVKTKISVVCGNNFDGHVQNKRLGRRPLHMPSVREVVIDVVVRKDDLTSSEKLFRVRYSARGAKHGALAVLRTRLFEMIIY